MGEKRSFFKSVENALAGLKLGYKERNFKIQTGVAILVLVGIFTLNVPPAERLIVILLIGVVLTAELLNTAIEHTLDIITREHHPNIAKAKDTAASAVLLISLTSAVIGIYIFSKALDLL